MTSSSLARLMKSTNAAEPVVGCRRPRVVEQRQVRPDVAQQEQLADAVEHVRAGGQAGVRRGLGQHAVAEAVEVADG